MLRLHFTCILLLAASTPAQTVDGEYPILQQWDGGSSDYHGWCVACAGDVNADGFSHRVLASRSGVGPIHYGVDIPLGYDPLLLRSSYCKYPATFPQQDSTKKPRPTEVERGCDEQDS